MGRQLKGLLYFYMADARHSFIIFWTILMSILVLSLVASYLLADGEGFMSLSLTAPLYVYFAIYGFLSVKEFIPSAIKMGATRKNIMISLALFFFGLAIVKAAVDIG